MRVCLRSPPRTLNYLQYMHKAGLRLLFHAALLLRELFFDLKPSPALFKKQTAARSDWGFSETYGTVLKKHVGRPFCEKTCVNYDFTSHIILYFILDIFYILYFLFCEKASYTTPLYCVDFGHLTGRPTIEQTVQKSTAFNCFSRIFFCLPGWESQHRWEAEGVATARNGWRRRCWRNMRNFMEKNKTSSPLFSVSLYFDAWEFFYGIGRICYPFPN